MKDARRNLKTKGYRRRKSTKGIKGIEGITEGMEESGRTGQIWVRPRKIEKGEEGGGRGLWD